MSESLVLVANARDGSLSLFGFDGTALERISVTGGLTGCSTFAVDPARDLVYAAVKGEPPGLVTLSLDRDTGHLEEVSRRDLPRGGMTYLALARDGEVLLGASYGGGYGFLSTVVDGVVGDPVSEIEYANLHAVLPDPSGRFAYFVALGDDLVAQYAITDDPSLAPLEPATVAFPAGTGPRHLVVGAEGDAVYVLTEFSADVVRLRRDRHAGTLTYDTAVAAHDPAAGLPRGVFGEDPRVEPALWGADLHWGAGERHLWASERSTSTLTAVPVAADGSLGPATTTTPTEPQPRGFAVSADGAHLVAAGERSTTVSLYAVDGARLHLLQQVETGGGANWVRFIGPHTPTA
ncbi:beta-propeller fold lactonase family protein [Microbacterium aquimaris]|uniref:lactonase family protein n=1 Tax=Microbacterium aquimaris TaxID=459816 RepID=UPI002AD56A93|nr:beta-propeller fold lactonase family protein [Microbacterium aquimaris]MDZ8276601.1 beta-propeller fold lactonase family protein [Microbacterium aquimaris]